MDGPARARLAAAAEPPPLQLEPHVQVVLAPPALTPAFPTPPPGSPAFAGCHGRPQAGNGLDINCYDS
jgi:hypothetical protein